MLRNPERELNGAHPNARRAGNLGARSKAFVVAALIGLALTTEPSRAGGGANASFRFLPASSEAEKSFQEKMAAHDYHEALNIWRDNLSASSFARSTNGIATYAYLLLQNGMPYAGVELLFQSTKFNQLNPELAKLWSAELKKSPLVQKGWIPSQGSWKAVVLNQPATILIRNKSDVSSAFRRADLLPKDQPNAKARIWWKVATLAPQIGDTESALKALNLIKNSPQTVIAADMQASALGRVLYQKGDVAGAQTAFSQIPKASSLWMEAAEERAWADLRQDHFDKALGEVTTLLSPALSPLSGPEPYFLANLMNLKICDYTRLFKTSDLFKQRHRARLAEMQQIASGQVPANTAALLERLDRGGVNTEAAGSLVGSLPRTAYRDAKFAGLMESRRGRLAEAEKAKELGLNVDLINRDVTAAENSKKAAIDRLRTLAQTEVKEYRIILNKMHIIEAEVIERMHLDDNLKGERGPLTKSDDKGDVLIFPYNTNEVWLDELDNYKARVKDCPKLKSASANALNE